MHAQRTYDQQMFVTYLRLPESTPLFLTQYSVLQDRLSAYWASAACLACFCEKMILL